LFKKKGFEFRVKLRTRQEEEKNQEQCRVMEAPKAAAVVLEENSKVQENGGFAVSLQRERTEGRCRVMTSEERVVWLD